MLSCLTSINSNFDQWHVRKQGLKMTYFELSKKKERIVEEGIVEEGIVERSTCFALNVSMQLIMLCENWLKLIQCDNQNKREDPAMIRHSKPQLQTTF